MVVTEMIDVNKKQSKVFLDGSFAFVLYKGEIRRYHIKEGAELSESDYDEIVNVVLRKRAKLRAMHLLKSMDRTEAQLRSKLKDGGYPEEIVTAAIEYVKSYGYINDESYAERYIEANRNKKSQRRIATDLGQKGIPKEVFLQFLEEKPVDECSQIHQFLVKKRYCPEEYDYKMRQKLGASLQRKGFSFENIKKVLADFSSDE